MLPSFGPQPTNEPFVVLGPGRCTSRIEFPVAIVTFMPEVRNAIAIVSIAGERIRRPHAARGNAAPRFGTDAGACRRAALHACGRNERAIHAAHRQCCGDATSVRIGIDRNVERKF